MSKKNIDSQVVNELFFKWLSLSAKIAIKNGRKKISTNDVSQGIKYLNIESCTGSLNTHPDPLIRDAYDYFTERDKHKLARNIKGIYVDSKGNPIIP